MNGKKPPYSIPSMKEILNIKPNGFNVVSTFSGGGGSCLGYRMAGYKVLYANEFIPEAQRTYKANFKDTYLDTRDIRQVKPEEILKIIGLDKYELDLFDGSPPCSAFSTAGSREKHWGEKKKYSDGFQRVDDLFFEYIRILKGLMPKCFIAENVTGLVKGKAKGYFKLILKELKRSGYRVKAVKINAAYLGVPQKRERIIFLGVRNDLGLNPVAPKPFNYTYSIKEALNNLPDENEKLAKSEREIIKKYKSYSIIKKMPKNPKKTVKGLDIVGHGWFGLQRPPINQPCPTYLATNITGGACLIHPYEDRAFTSVEAKRIMSVPDDFILTGDETKKRERLGRMVPPIMMMNISKTIAEEVLCKMKS